MHTGWDDEQQRKIDTVDELTAENAKLREQLRILIEGDEAADELIMMFRAEIQYVVDSSAVNDEAKAKSRAILAKIDAYHEKYT